MGTFLEDNKNDRSVLFGRLLAVYDYMEQLAMLEYDEEGNYKKGQEQRTTNAKRYWNAYSSRPRKTLKIIHERMLVYEEKLNDFTRKKFESWIGEIMLCLAENGFDNTALSEMYLPGYYLQMEEMKHFFKKKEQ